METTVLLIMILVCMSIIIKLSFMRLVSAIIISLIIAVVIYSQTGFAASQSGTIISQWLANNALMSDITVLLTIDVALQIAFCILMPVKATGAKRIVKAVLLYFPGILIFPVLFYCLVALLFEFTGADFYTVSGIVCGIILVAFPLLRTALKWLLPYPVMRLELMFYFNLLIVCLGIIMSVSGKSTVAGVTDLNLAPLGVMFLLFVMGTLIGLIIYNRNKSKRI